MKVGVSVALFVLAATAACGPQAEPTVLDPAFAGYVGDERALHAVPSEPPSTAALRARFPFAASRPALCNEAFLVDDVDSGDGVVRSALPDAHVLYVDALAAEAADALDGSEHKPFRSIGDALAHASTGTWIFVAPGLYAEQLTIPGGVKLSGRQPLEPEGTGALPVVTASAMTFSASAGPDEISMLESFEVYGTLHLMPNARVILRDNVLSPTLGPIADATSGNTHVGNAVIATQAALRATNNRLFVGSDNPGAVNSQGFHLTSSCALMTDNHLTDYRTPFSLRESDVVMSFNVIDKGRNGFFVNASRAIIAANYARLVNVAGCVYAVYMEGASRPEISDNQFYLRSSGTRGLNEADVASDPVKVVANLFRLGVPGTAIYLDRFAEGSGGARLMTGIRELNALGDVPEVFGNGLSVDSN